MPDDHPVSADLMLSLRQSAVALYAYLTADAHNAAIAHMRHKSEESGAALYHARCRLLEADNAIVLLGDALTPGEVAWEPIPIRERRDRNSVVAVIDSALGRLAEFGEQPDLPDDRAAEIAQKDEQLRALRAVLEEWAD